jgi:SAM-dependent methyltransferase
MLDLSNCWENPMNVEVLDAVRERRTARIAGACRLCAAPLTRTFVDLGMSPLCEDFRREEQLGEVEHYYPLHVYVCEQCFLVQLMEYVNPEAIFTEYAYFSSYSTSWVAHAKRYCEDVTGRYGLGAQSLAVELASNDGYLLQHFGPLGVPVLGIEPAANVAKVALEKGIPTRVEFFGTKLARKLVAEGIRADLIVGNNVLAQVPDLNDFVAGMKLLLKPEGVITLEFPHLERLIEENQFDTIYHEHFSYFSLLTTREAARRHGLRITDVEELPTHGGSLRVHLAHDESAHAVSPRVDALLLREQALRFDSIEGYSGMAPKVMRVKRDLLAFLIAAKNEKKTVCGYGAPGKGNTLLNYCGIGTDFLDFTVDRNPYKHGRYTPGMHIPILPVEALDRRKPDYILILPWNLKAEIVRQMHHAAAWGAKFVVPIPYLSIIDPRETLE